MKASLLLLLVSSVSAFASPVKDARSEVRLLLNEAAARTEQVDRLDYFSSKFIGLPYGLSGPLGEGENGRYDQDPLYRFDTFDCTTFVETVVSLARSFRVQQFEETMNSIRYRNGFPDYFERNHFPSMQWIPQNINKGFFVEINRSLMPANQVRTATTVNDYGNWLRFATIDRIQVPGIDEDARTTLLNELKGHAIEYTPKAVSIEYLAISDLLAKPELLEKIPSGSIVNFVRPNWNIAGKIGTNLLVSHQGLLFQKEGKLVLRHASSGAEKRVVEVLFLDYLRAIKPESSLKGIHLLH